MRRFIVPLFVILTFILAACGGGGTGSSSGPGGVSQQGLAGGNSYLSCPSSTNTTAAAPESGTVTLTVSGWSSSPAEDALVQQNLRNFEQSHPNIKVNWSPIPGDYPTKMRANVASGTVPDVFYLQPGMSSEYIGAGKLLNLSPYMARDGIKASDYYSALTNPFTCTSGQVFGLPKDWNSLGDLGRPEGRCAKTDEKSRRAQFGLRHRPVRRCIALGRLLAGKWRFSPE